MSPAANLKSDWGMEPCGGTGASSEENLLKNSSMPSFEATPMLYMLTKSKMTWLFARVVERSQSVLNLLTHEEAMGFDQELRDLRAQHPPLLCMRSFQESARDPANIIMQRLGLEMMFLRATACSAYQLCVSAAAERGKSFEFQLGP